MGSYTISEEQNGLLLFTINRPEKRNAVNYEIMDGLEEVLSVAANKETKALVLTGAGDRAFCSGGDLSVFHKLRTADEAAVMLSRMAEILTRLLMLPIPTVAILNGTAIGGGCEIASACDFRLGRKGMQAGFVQGNMAITTGWGGGSILFEKLPSSIALKMLGDARLYSADELYELGFLDYLYDGDAMCQCISFLERMLDKETAVLSAYKQLVTKKWMASSLPERIAAEARNCATLWGEEVHHEKVAQFLKK
ncbi:enoyl-CoA hydratase [Mesobacillus campisalis]|uniref:Ethylmalonyl-CoA decarboxylase n=2 Tax=Mesobacillus campisalis TaxID=1408103 RepID=A0A0M2SYS1_9BACI|nr:enoyl-CoA hydratase/isomerase family protein [Mesobacillus campisalis]KKK39719.1 enoyl-CoA hydratase [Mesobacillus campisalis]